MTATHKVVAEVPLGRGALVVEQTAVRPRSAFVDGKAGDGQRRRRVVYRCGTVQTRLQNLGDILTVANDEQVEIRDFVSQWPYEFAVVFSSYVGLGTVVRATARFAYLHSRYGIDLEEHRPRLCDGDLRFLVLHADLGPEPPSLREVRWRLSTMTHQTALVAVLDKTESAEDVNTLPVRR